MDTTNMTPVTCPTCGGENWQVQTQMTSKVLLDEHEMIQYPASDRDPRVRFRCVNCKVIYERPALQHSARYRKTEDDKLKDMKDGKKVQV